MSREDNGFRHLPWKPGETVVTRTDLFVSVERECARLADKAIKDAMENAKLLMETKREGAKIGFDVKPTEDKQAYCIVPYRPRRQI